MNSMEINENNFYEKTYKYVKGHSAIDNAFINRFAKGDLSNQEFARFSVEFYHFTREWPAILGTLLVNTPNEEDAANLTTILVSELGDMDPTKRHELLYRKYLRSLGFDPAVLVKKPQLPTTKAWLDGMRTFFSGDYYEALGAEFGLENMAIPMWDKILSGFNAYFKKNPEMKERVDIEYFTFHRELEAHHEEAMEDVLGTHKSDPEAREKFMQGAKEILDLEEKFWLGLATQ
ncbi:MAG: iron-containing redox enzyme family protein [Candidatus Thermoplasmatota archaeon]|jgi:pyrroloquinoline quinone (PQQ) biosynthesis protein C|nr:iron-containing redox enzyme family protein [Candidatus Thermoplasmatota archaeon]MCL5987760.1 iron-containing redox enzyme family protein [Candidatus Thermoplasmatota archaeon]